MPKRSHQDEIRRAVRPYRAPVLLLYDTGVYRIWNPYVWQCPSNQIESHFRRHVRSNHLEAGCGTGYLPDRCGLPAGPANQAPRLTLLDLSAGSLKWSSRRLKAHQPRLVRHNLFEPLPPDCPRFDSINCNYVLHCLPGSPQDKETVLLNLKNVLTPGGILFGSTILGAATRQSPAAGMMNRLYNFIGSFHNRLDTAAGFRQALENNFRQAQCRQVGSVLLFAASDAPLSAA